MPKIIAADRLLYTTGQLNNSYGMTSVVLIVVLGHVTGMIILDEAASKSAGAQHHQPGRGYIVWSQHCDPTVGDVKRL